MCIFISVSYSLNAVLHFQLIAKDFNIATIEGCSNRLDWHGFQCITVISTCFSFIVLYKY